MWNFGGQRSLGRPRGTLEDILQYIFRRYVVRIRRWTDLAQFRVIFWAFSLAAMKPWGSVTAVLFLG
jgi:hypothetical protein